MTDVERSHGTASNGIINERNSNLEKSGGRVTFEGGSGIEDDHDFEQPSTFVRGVSHDSQYLGGVGHRLSTVIRRSLRLAPKRSVSSGNRSSSSRFPPHITAEEKGQPFTQYSDLRQQKCDTPYGTIDELEYYIRLNRINQQSEEVIRVISPAVTPMTSATTEAGAKAIDRSRTRFTSKSSEIESYPSVQRKSSEAVGLCRFSASFYYESQEAGESSAAPDSQRPPLQPYNSTDSGLTSDSSAGSDSDGDYSSLDSIEGKKQLRRLPRQSAISEDSSKRYSIIDRSFSVDSGYTDDGYRTSKMSNMSSDFQQATKFAKTWNKFYEFLRKIEGSPDFSAKVKAKIQYVKKFVRNNDWPASHEIRSQIWKALCHTKDFDVHKRLYTEQLENLTKSGVKTLTPLCLSFDGIVVHDHGLKEQGAVTLQRLLIVVECVRPEIRYVPILYPLCAMFLHYMGAEETFACVMRLLSQGNGFMLQSEVAVYASSHTILALLKKHMKKVYKHLKSRIGSNDEDKLAEIYSNWAAWIFKHLPFEHLVRVIDCFLVEGHKMLLRVVLALTYVWYKEKGKLSLPPSFASKSVDEKLAFVKEEIIQVIQDCPISISTLLDICISIRNFKFSTVQRLQSDFEAKHRDKINYERSLKQQFSPSTTMYTQVFCSDIIDSEVASELMSALPNRFQLETPALLFRLSENGVSFTNLWNLIDNAEQTLIIIKSTKNEVFGAYCSASWSERKDIRERTRSRYFGTGESFVWYRDPEIGLPIIYRWSGYSSDQPQKCPQMFMTAGDRLMIIGSKGGDAICIREQLTDGLSYECETFASPPLVKGNAFDIAEMEVFNVISSTD